MAIPGPIHTKTHGHLWPISHNPGTIFNSPETQQWAVHGQPTCPISVSLFGTEFLTHFLSYKHPSIISHTHSPTSFLDYHGQPKVSKIPTISVPCFRADQAAHSRPFSYQACIFNTKSPHKQPTTCWTITAIKRISKKFLTIRSQVLGPIKRPLTASNQPKHRKTLKNGNKTQVGRNPYLLEFVKTRKSGVHASPAPRRTFSLLAPSKSNGRILCISREKEVLLSLTSSIFGSAAALVFPLHLFAPFEFEEKSTIH